MVGGRWLKGKKDNNKVNNRWFNNKEDEGVPASQFWWYREGKKSF